ATGLLRSGTPVEVVSKLLGHASVTTTVEVTVTPERRGRPSGAGAGGLVHRQHGGVVSAPSPARPPGLRRRMLLEGLLGAVRPEFRADMLIFPAEDPVFGGGACRVGDCRRPARGRGLCQGHYLRWVGEDRPDLGLFAESTDPRWRRQRPDAACRVVLS
ncbi:MAG: hypothetical protein LC808_05190, partial [Actinobacteria bacterium]|nr:hypothetical protein [Actinomycetota bacterium]